MTPVDWCYDEETYPNCFTIGFEHCDSDEYHQFELSWRKDEREQLFNFIAQRPELRMVGYNNIGFDYLVLHLLLMNPQCSVQQLYDHAMRIINASDDERFSNMVWESDWLRPQIDLYKIHHFDNANKRTSLKMLEFNMRMDNISDLPFPVGMMLDSAQIDTLLAYMRHDIKATKKFYHRSKAAIDFREELTEKYGKNFINHNDTKIGKDYFIMRLGDDMCYTRASGRKEPRQTPRHAIRLSDVVFPYIKFEHPEFERVRQWLVAQTIYETKGVFTGLTATVNGFTYVFGAGGIHGSVESQIVSADDEYQITDFDVASYYPNLAIKNKIYPEHLGTEFCDTYLDVYQQRQQHPKKKFPAINAMLKLALNGVYGDSNSVYSPFYDPQYTMKITINGQLLLCMLAEQLVKVVGLSVIQINTDGVTVRYPRANAGIVKQIADWWQQNTLLELEAVEYSAMYIRDVNNYLAVTTDGSIKRKGAYCYIGSHTDSGAELGWHQPHSSLVVPMAAEAALLFGADIREFITAHSDWYNFMNVVKVPRSNTLEIGGQEVQRITRCYISHNGGDMVKVMPPGATKYLWTLRNPTSGKIKEVKSERGVASSAEKGFTEVVSKVQIPETPRRQNIYSGWKVSECNDMRSFNPATLNYEWYIAEAEKLVKPLLTSRG